jgi:transglutaminase-like putative cysteine protease
MFSSLPVQRLWLLILFVWPSVTGLFAQKPDKEFPAIKFGKITPNQFTLSSADTTASAEVLYDYGKLYFEASSGELWMSFTHHVRTVIRKKSAYDRATIELPVRQGKQGQHEFIYEFDGYTYNFANGDVSIDRFQKGGHFTEKVSADYWVEKYTLTNVREGSIIEYRYTIHTPFSVSYNPRTWRFQQDVPVHWSEYQVSIPDYFYYKMLQGGYLPLFINENRRSNLNLLPGQEAVGTSDYRFVVKDAPAFRNEAYITTDDDYLSKIDFELASYQIPGNMIKDLSVTWPALDQTLLRDTDFGGQLKRNSFLRETANALVKQHADTLGRIEAAYNFIRQSIKWNEEASIWSLQGIKKVFENKKGNAADINLMLIALLREMNIDANPVILSTRSHGRVNEAYPLLKKFNYVVATVMVGGKDLLLDATDVYLKPGMLPVRCLNGTGRLVHDTNPRFISLVPNERDSEVHTGKFTLDSEGDLTGTLTHSHGGYSAWSARKTFATEGQTKYLDEVRKKRPAWQIDKAEFQGKGIDGNTFNELYSLTIPEACSRAGDRLYFRPMLTEAHSKNPFKDPERLYPVDFGVAIDETYNARYALPEGFQVEETPKPVSVSLPNNGGRFIYQVSVSAENELLVTSRILLRQTMYYADDYPALREWFAQIVAKHAEQVVLKRVTVAASK